MQKHFKLNALIWIVGLFCVSTTQLYALDFDQVRFESGKKACILVASFDPPHQWHENVINECLKNNRDPQFNCDYLILSAEYQEDKKRPGRSDLLVRQEMLNAAYLLSGQVIVTGRDYATDFLPLLRSYEVEIVVGILGSDSALRYIGQELARVDRFLIFTRDEDRINPVYQGLKTLWRAPVFKMEAANSDLTYASIQEKVKERYATAGSGVPDLSDLLIHPNAIPIILQKMLYR